ncbi:unnamed protein product [Protopolystoma xenopodis]|uniref:Major facilitator superfamily (MFS) profile domain-containing protein n=1 Tax=Protopolystoma xenopodis TaxID=117903 RepID=A0A3S5AJL9_9PLAT|nr:unnamed protein product [Protopolystoma xenopodis]
MKCDMGEDEKEDNWVIDTSDDGSPVASWADRPRDSFESSRQARLCRLHGQTSSSDLESGFLHSLAGLFSTPELARRTLLGSLLSFASNFPQFGVLLHAGVVNAPTKSSPDAAATATADGNQVYRLTLFNSLASLMAALASLFMYRVFQARRPPLLLLLAGTLLATLAAGLVILLAGPRLPRQVDMFAVLTATSSLAIACLDAVTDLEMVYLAELFPTRHRSIGFGVCLAAMQLGSMSAALMNRRPDFTLLRHVATGRLVQVASQRHEATTPRLAGQTDGQMAIPLLVYAASAGLGLVVCLFLPDTHGVGLDDSIGMTSSSGTATFGMVDRTRGHK